jgi:UDP-N-acetyl-D-mannosaminuronate dehydrogenase
LKSIYVAFARFDQKKVRELAKEKVLVVGLGEVGNSLFDLLGDGDKFDVYGFDVDSTRMQLLSNQKEIPADLDVMHVCYPCSDQDRFIQTTLGYMKKFNPKLTIIDSTVAPGTTGRIYESSKQALAHSPVRGMHKTAETMKNDILFWRKFVAGATKESAEAAKKHFEKLGLNVEVLKNPIDTELGKLFDTIYKAWMIVCFQEMHRISMSYKADFDQVVDFIEDGHRVLFDRPPHYPSFIGGHCLIQNTEMLLKSYDSDLLRLILESNKKRKEEGKQEEVQQAIAEIRKKVEKLETEISRKRGQK